MNIVLLIIPAIISCISSSIPIGILYIISQCTKNKDVAEVCYIVMKLIFLSCMIMSYSLTMLIMILDS